MNGKQLKNAILQLAIQGKLVPQDDSDEPVSALLAQIRKEKEQLLKAGKLKKKDLATTPITDDEKPFGIPEGWEWCRIEEISDSYIGLTYKPTDVAENGTVVLRSSNIQDGRIDLNDKVKVNLSIPEKLIVHENDILICARNGSSKLVGKSALITKEADGMTFGAFMAICKTSFYDFVYQFLQSDLFFSQLREVSGTTTINQLTQKNFNSFIIPLPPLAEQHRIVSKIEELMPLVEEYGAAQEKLNQLNEALPEALKKSILQQAIQGKLVPQDPKDEPASALLAKIRKEKEQLVKAGKLKKKDLATTPISDEEKPFDIPESWEWVRLGEIFSHNNGKQLNRADTKGELHDYITTSNLYWDSFDLKEVRQMLFTDEELVRCTATKGDLLVCEGGDVGRSAIWDKDFDICIQNHIHRLRAYCQLCTRYFLYLLMFNKSTGLIGGKGIGIQGLSAKALHNILVALPPLAEQKRIVTKIEELMAMVDGMK